MGKVYSVVNQKGGVGKTTTVVNVSAVLANSGRKVLVVDLDPQGNATSGLGIDKNTVGKADGPYPGSTYDVMIRGMEMTEAIAPTPIENLFILPSNLELAGAELELMPRIAREGVLNAALFDVRDSYDFIFVDAPPSLALLTVNALVAADYLIIPIQCEYYALEGVSLLMRTIGLIRKQLNPQLQIGLVVLTMYDGRARLNQQVVEEVRRVFQDRVARRMVPRNIRIAEAPSHGLPVTQYDSQSRGAAAYREIAQEVSRIGT